MTSAELRQYVDRLLRDYPLGELYIPRRFTALPESGSISSDLGLRSYGFLREREPQLKELLTHPAIAIVADPGGGKSVVGRAAIYEIASAGERVPVFAEVKQYRGDLAEFLRLTAPPEVLAPEALVDGVGLKRTYIFDGIDEVPAELIRAFGTELREFVAREPQANFVCTARQAFYVANRDLLPSIPAVFHILPLADEDIDEYATRSGIHSDQFKEAINAAGTNEQVRNPFILSIIVEQFRSAGHLNRLKSENLAYMVDRLIQNRPQINAHRQRRALRMLGVAMETYSRNELTELEAMRVITEAMRITEIEARELLNELYASILKRTANGLSFQLASYGEYLAAEALEDASFDRLQELAFLNPNTPNDSWANAVSFLLELNSSIRAVFVRRFPFWALSSSPAAFSENEKDKIVNQILQGVTAENQLVSDHPRIQVRRLSDFITETTESVLLKDLASKNDIVLGNALVLLGVRGSSEVVPLSMEILSDRSKSSELRSAAVVALVNSGGEAEVPKLIELAENGEDDLHINIVDLIGGLTTDAQLPMTLPVILRTDAGLSAAYYHFRELKSRTALVETLRYFLAHPNEFNSIRAEGYVRPIFELLPRHWDYGIAQLLAGTIELIEVNQIFPNNTGALKELFQIVKTTDIHGEVARLYLEGTRGEEQARRARMFYVNQLLADLITAETARWIIDNTPAMIEQLAPYARGEVREILRPHSNGIIDQQDAASERYWAERTEAERKKKTNIMAMQDRLLLRRTLAEAFADFFELRPEHWPELPQQYREWLRQEISRHMQDINLETSIEWRENSLWQPQSLPLLLQIIDRYQLQIEPDELMVFAAMSMDQNAAANHYRRFGLSDRGRQTLERLLTTPPSIQAQAELISFIGSSKCWSEPIARALRTLITEGQQTEYVRENALRLLAENGVESEFLEEIWRNGLGRQLKQTAFIALIEQQHRPTIERALARLADDTELRRGDVPMPNQTPLDWIAHIRGDFVLARLVSLRERALILELPTITQLLSNTIGKINRRELVRVIRRQMSVTPRKWQRWQQTQAIEQERTAVLEEAQRTPFDEVIRKLKGATSINRLLLICEGSTDIPVFQELLIQVGEIPQIMIDHVGGWSGLRNKDPNVLLLVSKTVIVVMDGDEGRKLTKHGRPLTQIARREQARLANHGIELCVLTRYGIENYFPQTAIEQVIGIPLSAFFPVPDHVAVQDHLSRDSKGLRYQFRCWVAQWLDLKRPEPKQPLYSKSQNQRVAKVLRLDADLRGTDLYEIIARIAERARDLEN